MVNILTTENFRKADNLCRRKMLQTAFLLFFLFSALYAVPLYIYNVSPLPAKSEINKNHQLPILITGPVQSLANCGIIQQQSRQEKQIIDSDFLQSTEILFFSRNNLQKTAYLPNVFITEVKDGFISSRAGPQQFPSYNAVSR